MQGPPAVDKHAMLIAGLLVQKRRGITPTLPVRTEGFQPSRATTLMCARWFCCRVLSYNVVPLSSKAITALDTCGSGAECYLAILLSCQAELAPRPVHWAHGSGAECSHALLLSLVMGIITVRYIVLVDPV